MAETTWDRADPAAAVAQAAIRSPSRTWSARSRLAGRRRRSAAATYCWSAPASTPGRGASGGAATPVAPPPSLSFGTLDWLYAREVVAVSTDTRGVEVRPNEFDEAFQPFHQVALPHMGPTSGEMWHLDGLAADCAGDVGSPVNPPAIK
jgi:hypothetical protein